MKIREFLDKHIKDKTRYGHLMILFYSDLDKEIKDVIKEYEQYAPQSADHLRRLIKEFGLKEENMGNTVEFDGSGKEILELLKKALCEFENVYIINAFLHPHHGFADEGRATLDIYINIPDEKKWIDIHYHHHEAERIPGGYGKISYVEHYYHREPFPESHIRRWKDEKFTWGYDTLSGDYILDEILERKKCRNYG